MISLDSFRQNFETNLEILRSIDPDLAQRLASRTPPPGYYMVESEKKTPTLQFKSEKDAIFLHSRNDPVLEAQREIKNLIGDEPSVYVLLGLGLGYALEELIEKHIDKITGLLLIERDIDLFFYFLHRRKWEDLFSIPTMRIVVSDHPEKILPATKSLLPQIMGSGIRFIDHRPSAQIFNQFYKQEVDCLRKFLQQAIAESEYLVQYGSVIQQNAVANLPAIFVSHGLGPLRDFYKNHTAVLISAGPSLTKNLHQLKDYPDQVLIFCVDTAYSLALKHDIQPDFVAATDPTPLNAKHFEGIPPDPNTILIFESDVYPSIPLTWKGPKIFINSEKAAINQWIESTAGPFGTFDQSLSVAHTLFTAASWLGCDPIILIGHDLAYDNRTQTTHANDTALNRSFASIQSHDKHVTISPTSFHPETTREEITWVLSVMGELVPTSKTMAIYLQKLSDSIRQSSIRVFDATEGGALIEGTIPTRLKQILSTQEPQPVSPDLVKFLNDHQDPQEHQGLTQFNQIIQGLQLAYQTANQGLELGETLLQKASHPEYEKTLKESKEWKLLDQLFWAIYRDENVKIGLEQALFSALFTFIRYTPEEKITVRLKKYIQVFSSTIHLIQMFIPHFEKARDTVYPDAPIEHQ